MNIQMRRIPSYIAFLTGLICGLLIFVAVRPYNVAEAGCPNIDPPGWTQGTGIITYIQVGGTLGFTSNEALQVNGALKNWTYNNTVFNCSDVYFDKVDSLQPSTALIINADPGQRFGEPSAAGTDFMVRTGSQVDSAQIVLWWGAMGTVPAYNRNGSAQYYKFIRKEILHEVGHSMAISEPSSQSPGDSVMNNWGLTNDSDNFKPDHVTFCDNGFVNLWYGTTCTWFRLPLIASACVAAGMSWNESSHICGIPACPSGEVWDSTIGGCVPEPDEDGDGYTTSQGDCNDNNSAIHPGAAEICDGIDNDCNGQTDEGCGGGGCGGGFHPCFTGGEQWCEYTCACIPTGECTTSPILIDVLGNGFDLTSAIGGVNFDLNSDGTPERLSWASTGSDDAWLALDRNGNGKIDSGQELFGNFTPQPSPPQGQSKNGFLALAEYDKPANGGNGDGQIDSRDAIFSSLRLWQDINHNGISEPNELHTLPGLGVAILDLDYKESKRTDQYGNQFKYRAKVKDVHGDQVGRWAWDVFLVRQ